MTSMSTGASQPWSAWLKSGAIVLAIFLVSWSIAIWYWRGIGHSPEPRDLVLVLLVLPSSLLLAGWAWHKTAARLALAEAGRKAPLMSASTAAAAAVAGAPVLAIVATALRSPHGASVEELAGAIADNAARAALDAELVDDNGFPVMSARSEEAHDAALQDEIAAWLDSQGMPHLHFGEEQWRALVLASGVADDLGARAGELMPASGKPPMLQLTLLLPQDWSVDVRTAATMWLKQVVCQHGWPAASTTASDVFAQDRQASPAAVLHRLLPRSTEDRTPLVAIVIACASLIGQDSVDRLAAASRLFTSAAQARGDIPGEGAAGLLLSDVHGAEHSGAMHLALLGPVVARRLAVSADEARRVDSTVLVDMAQEVGTNAAIALSQIDMIVADTAHRVSRVLELMALAAPVIEQIDAADDIIRVGLGSGSCGAVPFITVIALAQHYTCARSAPVLCIGNEDPWLRGAALVRPMC